MITGQYDVEFTKDGSVHDQEQVAALMQGLTDATDLLVLTHGWNNNMAEAQQLYDELTANFMKLPQPNGGPGSAIAVMRVFWPSKRFTNEDLIPGGGAASAHSENDTALFDALESLKRDPRRLGEDDVDTVRSANIDRAVAVVGELDGSAVARHEFVMRIRAVLNPDDAHDDDASREFFELEPDDLFKRFGEAVPVLPQAGPGGAAGVSGGGAAFFGDLISGAKAAARRIANYATYYQMKARAGAVGRSGLATTLAQVRERHKKLPVHLVGHSFGGRAVTVAAANLPKGEAPVTLTLLQAAFSHNGLAEKFDGHKNGAFRTILADSRISGPILITNTRNDQAVGIAYPLASRISRDRTSALGDKNDPYGGMGRNGAQHTPEVDKAESELREPGGSGYKFAPGSVYNLKADKLIKDHGDVRNEAVANLLLHAISAR